MSSENSCESYADVKANDNSGDSFIYDGPDSPTLSIHLERRVNSILLKSDVKKKV